MESKLIKYHQIYARSDGDHFTFPKYTTQLINLANQNAQGTRPKVVGKMSDLITEFSGNTLQEWGQWYRVRKPEAIDEAVEKVYSMVVALKEAIALIDKGMVKEYIEDLLINKTFQGFKIQKKYLIISGKRNTNGIQMCNKRGRIPGN